MEAPKSPLNAANPEHITFYYPPLHLAVLGGIRLDGLDRMRVTLKITYSRNSSPDGGGWEGASLRHNLDLYNDNQTEKLIRRAAEKLEVGTSFISKSLAELTTELEKYRLGEIAKQKVKQETKKIITEEEKQNAIAFLQTPDLMIRTNEMIGRSGMIGEESNRLLMYIIFTSRKREHPLHIISLGSSGTGKTYLQEKVSELIPTEDKVSGTSITDNALYYYGKHDLKHKLILIEDLTGVESMLYTLRELESKQRITKILAHKDAQGNTKTVSLIVEGPVSIAACTTQESIYEDNANRSFLIYLDESKEQDEKIMDYQRRRSAGKINAEQENKIKTLMQNCQRILQPITVINPFAEKLKIPSEVFKLRRTNKHYLDFIEAVTFYYQYQREQKINESTGEVFIETTLEDISEANQLMKEILLRKSDELTGACRNYFERLKNFLKQEKKKTFTNREIRTALRENHSNQKRFMLQLLQEGYIRRNIGNQKKGYNYQVLSYEEWNEMQNKITSVLDEILEKLKQAVQSSKAVQRTNEPLNGYENNKQFSKNGKQASARKKEVGV